MRVKKQKITIQDIANRISMTPSTVSRALNNHPGISETTRQLVLTTAKAMNYRPNHIAAALRSGKSYVIGVVVPRTDRTFFASIIRGIESEVADQGYGVIVCQTNDNSNQEKRALDILMRSQVDGIIASVISSSNSRNAYTHLQEEGVPIVFYDRIIESIQASSVVINDFRGGYIATQHLVDQGYTKIAHFAASLELNIYRERLRGYKAALKEAGLPIRQDWIVHCPSDIDKGFKAAQQLFATPNERPDALFSSSDYGALGALQYLKSQNIRIPEEVGLIGFANEPFTSYVEPTLSTIEQFSVEMGRTAARIFLNQLSDTDSSINHQTVLQPQLIVRDSSNRKLNP
ncbi:MAG: LacI family DNA-binding transcriptional regulator [Bacteroidota bacterium]